jgi:hypothetical protein
LRAASHAEFLTATTGAEKGDTRSGYGGAFMIATIYNSGMIGWNFTLQTQLYF